ncbi:MAG: carbon storage regulator CsrA [Lachnospiraceae bacterium]|nr:carbon storage regulator CsrA [Lachnospiraceae bacterium]
MLALSRKKGEALFINNNIEVTVLEVKGDQVKLGIKAPKEVPIYRSEVYEQIQAANKEALTEQTPDNLSKLFKAE